MVRCNKESAVAVRTIDTIFNPRRIALVGVTQNPNSVGGKVLANLVGGGFRGVVFPVNPEAEAVLGVPCFPDVKSLPKVADLAVICSPAAQVPDLVRQCGESGTRGVIILSAGFREAGEEGGRLEQRVAAEASGFDGMRIIGPNCLGIIVPHLNLNVSFASHLPPKGHVAFISQSGALCTSVLDWALKEKIGFSYFISVGNMLDVDYGDLIDFLGEDENTKSIILYIESISRARKFMTAARAFALTKPIIAYKAGRFPESAAVAASHTGAMAAEDAVYDAAFHRTGVARVYDIGEIFDVAELVGRHKIPSGPRLGIVTNAGGPGVMATDALIAANGSLARLSEKTMEILNQSLPPMWSRRNPVDVLGDARSKRLAKAAKIVLEDEGVDALLTILTPQAMTNPTTTAREIAALAQKSPKPILCAWLGGLSMAEGIRILNEAGVATYHTPEQAVRAFMTLVDYSRNLESLYETPKDIPVEFTLDRKKARGRFKAAVTKGDPILSEDISKTLLESYGIPTTKPFKAATEDEAVSAAQAAGCPVVMKIHSPDITHKTEAGGVALNLADTPAVRKAFTGIMRAVKKNRPEARLEGVTIQPMRDTSRGVELILGAKKDAVFGAVLMVGMGGITAELYGDRMLGFPPLNENLVRRMLESLKLWPLLQGYRGKQAAAVDKLVEAIIRLSYFIADYPEIKELDINPLLVTPEDVVALDARIVIDSDALERPGKPYDHLALRPYPEEYVSPAQLRDGSRIVLRPIKPEDEPMWFQLLGSCSKESIYARFRYFFHWETHQVASRYCFNDYDREIAIVAEQNDKSGRRLLGVGRLVADPDHQSVEYAVLVGDAWQNNGLGGLLTDYCIEIARDWGLKTIFAQTTSDNPRMIAVFRKREFDIRIDPRTSLVEVSRDL
jgi:acetyltransferase